MRCLQTTVCTSPPPLELLQTLIKIVRRDRPLCMLSSLPLDCPTHCDTVEHAVWGKNLVAVLSDFVLWEWQEPVPTPPPHSRTKGTFLLYGSIAEISLWVNLGRGAEQGKGLLLLGSCNRRQTERGWFRGVVWGGGREEWRPTWHLCLPRVVT